MQGKDKVDFAPHLDNGDVVVVKNAQHVVFTGKKWKDKLYRHHTGYAATLLCWTICLNPIYNQHMTLYWHILPSQTTKEFHMLCPACLAFRLSHTTMTYIKQGQESTLVMPLPAAHHCYCLSAQNAHQLVPVSTSNACWTAEPGVCVVMCSILVGTLVA